MHSAYDCYSVPTVHCLLLFFAADDTVAEKKSLKVHKNENFFGFDFEICTFS